MTTSEKKEEAADGAAAGVEAKKDARAERGRRIARRGRIRRAGRYYVVPSQSNPSARYMVDVEERTCTCPDFDLRRAPCKHVHAVLSWIASTTDDDAIEHRVEEPADERAAPVRRRTYPQEDWPAYHASQVREGEHFERLLRDLCAGLTGPPPRTGPGRRPRPVADLAFAAVMKVYSRMSARRVQYDLRQCVARGSLGSPGGCNAISSFLASPSSTAILELLVEESAAPLKLLEDGQFAIDSTGMSLAVYDRWFDCRSGARQSRRGWVKLHVVVGTATHVVASARVSPTGDAPMLPALLDRAARQHDIRELSADLAYSSVENHEHMERVNVAAYIPFKVNAVVNPKSRAWSRNLGAFLFHQDHFLPHYHKRSNVEAVFSMIKRKFGGAVASRGPVAQANEVLAKCVAHNLCCVAKAIVVSGLAPTFWPGSPATAAPSDPAAPRAVEP